MKIPSYVKLAAVGFLLFAAIAVDFVSKFMSIGFDLFFISLAVWILWPMVKNSLEEKD